MTIQELARRARVTPRTIRYYVEQGVLPPPERGRPARYTGEHLRRLALIRRLKEQYLPLEEIRDTLARLTPEEVEALLARSEPPPREERLTSAAEYITHVMDRGAAREEMKLHAPPPQPAPSAPPASPASVTSSPSVSPAPQVAPGAGAAPLRKIVERFTRKPEAERDQEALGITHAQEAFRLGSPAQSEPGTLAEDAPSEFGHDDQQTTWRRVTLAPGIELHYRQTNDTRINETVARLLEAAAQVLERLPERWRNPR